MGPQSIFLLSSEENEVHDSLCTELGLQQEGQEGDLEQAEGEGVCDGWAQSIHPAQALTQHLTGTRCQHRVVGLHRRYMMKGVQF
jgi:hypothetical protein